MAGVHPEAGRCEQRPLGIPRVKDRVAQTAAKLVLEAIFEADFRGCSFGFRPQRSAHQALDQIKREVMRGRRWVIDADIRGFFDALDPQIRPEQRAGGAIYSAEFNRRTYTELGLALPRRPPPVRRS